VRTILPSRRWLQTQHSVKQKRNNDKTGISHIRKDTRFVDAYTAKAFGVNPYEFPASTRQSPFAEFAAKKQFPFSGHQQQIPEDVLPRFQHPK